MNSPFKFLRAYNAEDVEHFFGRDEEVETLYNMVFKTNLLLVYGLSGTGKTSLIQCGLASRFDDSEWYPFWVRRQNNINDALNKTLNTAIEGNTELSVVDKIREINEKFYRPVYLVFDQFEELFILGSKEEQISCVANIKAILDANLQCKIILIMREEYIGRIYPYEATVPKLFKHRFRVEQMGPNKIKSIIEQSFNAFNVEVEAPADASINLIMDKLSDSNNTITLPYLQVYLDILYRSEYKKTIGDKKVTEKYPILPVTQDDINEMGDIADVLEKFLDQQQSQLYKDLKPQYQELTESSIPNLLDVFITEDGTKRPIQIKRKEKIFKLIEDGTFSLPNLDHGLIQKLIEKLGASRILYIDDDSVELAHDSLALLLEKRRSDEQREINQLRKRIHNGFQEYQDSGTFLNQRQLDTFLDILPQLNLPDEILYFIDSSKRDAAAKLNQELDRQKKEMEAEQKMAQAELLQGKLNAEKKAHRRAQIAATIAAVAIPLLLYFGWNANKHRLEAEANTALLFQEKQTVDSLYKESVAEQEAMAQLLAELENVQMLLDTLRNAGITDSTLVSMITTASSKIEEVKENEEVQELQKEQKATATQVVNMYTFLKGNKGNERDKFSPGSVVGFQAYLKLPEAERISWKWLNPDGSILKQKSENLGRNMTDRGGSLFDLKGVGAAGLYKVQIINGEQDVIKEISFTVE